MTNQKLSAVDALLELVGKNGNGNQTIASSPLDPALDGAFRDKNVLRLGVDPTIEGRAREAAELVQNLNDVKARFAAVQDEMRQYGEQKRKSYNDSFKTCVTSVSVPYSTGQVDANGQRETRHVTVVFTNKHTVNPDISNHKSDLGPAFDQLFVEKRTRTLKPDAENLMRGLLSELMLSEKDVDKAMQVLFEERVSISTSKNYESEEQKLSDRSKAIVAQFVRKANPSIRF